MTNLRKIENWQKIPNAGILLPDDSNRSVTIECNSEGTTLLSIQGESGDFFLGSVTGYRKFDFRVSGPVKLKAKGDACWFVCDEITSRHVTIHDEPETFTKVVERAPRNPQLELMMAKMNQSVEKRIRAMERDNAVRKHKADARIEQAERLARESAERFEAANNRGAGASEAATEAGAIPEPAVGGDGVAGGASKAAKVED